MTRRQRLRRPTDEGFTLVEAIVSLVIIAIVMTSFAVAMVGTVRASVVARQNQQAGDLLNRSLEEMRSFGWSGLANASSDITTTDGGLLTACPSGPVRCLTIAGVKEKVVEATGGSLTPHNESITLNKLTYTVRKYVTTPTDTETAATYRRLVVYVQWTSLKKSHTRLATTFVTDTRRGLQLPYYKFTPVGSNSMTVNTGATVVYGFKLVNNGARDTWNLTTSAPSLGWTWLKDDGDGVFDATKDTVPVADTTSDGIIDTGTIEPTTSVSFWVRRTIPASPAAPYTSTVTFTATSFAASSYATTLTTTTNVVSGVVTPTPTPTASSTASASPTPTATASASPSSSASSCPAVQPTPTPTASGVTQTGYWFYNDSNYGVTATTAQSPLYLTSDAAPASATLYDYSTDDGITSTGITAGRILKPSTLGVSETNPLKQADFRRRLSTARTITGGATATFWVTPQSGLSTDGVHLKVYLVTSSKSGGKYVATTRATAAYDIASWGCNTFNKVTLSLPGLSVKLANNDYLDVYVQNTGSSDVRLAYGNTTYPSGMVIPLS